MLHALARGFMVTIGAILAIALASGVTLAVVALLIALFADRH